ncbi:MAG: helix-turn-helix transcriptional regulator [Clostridia bacterium]|nr:helix-turn-helix transcriptional regulator [Clostridia bacterium]
MIADYSIYNNLYTIEERRDLIAQMIKELRIKNNLTQTEICKIIDVNKQTYNNYEKGRSTPPAEIIVRLSYLYEIPTDVLLQRDNLLKSATAQMRVIEQYEQQLAELKEQIKNKSPEEQATLKTFIGGLEQMLNALK